MKTSRMLFPVIGLILALMLFGVGCGGDSSSESYHQEPSLQDFDSAWSAADSVYPYFEYKEIDWNNIYTIYRSRAEQATGEEIIILVLEMLGELKDGHVWAKLPSGETIELQDGWVKSNSTVWPYYPPRRARDQNVWDTSLLFNYFTPNIVYTGNGLIGYPILEEDIGYIYTSVFYPHDIIDSLNDALDYVRDTKALIVDVRHNQGGDGDTIRAFVSRFLTEELEGMVYYIKGEFYQWPPMEPEGAFQYTSPAVVLINGVTFSGGEAFAEMMKQLSHVTAVGDTTGGGLGGVDNSAPGLFELPCGVQILIPTVDGRRYDGLPWEWLGVPPDIQVVQTEEDFSDGRDNQLEYAIEFLNNF